MEKFIAERKLLYTVKGGGERKELVIRIGQPYLVEEGTVNFRVGEGAAGCLVEFEGLSGEHLENVYGADLLQALQIAVDVEPRLKRLSKKYDFYFPSGEPYFELENDG